MEIRLVNINKSFNGMTVLKDLNMTIAEGRISCIMGASGSGKTTLTNILMGLVKQDDGKVEGLQGEKVSAVFQEERLVEHWDAIKNILLVCERNVTEAMVREHLNMVGLKEYENKPVKSLSGGMRRRVEIVRAILAEGQVLILDEPFKGLDEALKEQVIGYIKEHTDGRTVLIVTHDREDVKLLDADIHLLPKKN